MSWALVKLSDVCEINIGKTPSRANLSYWGKGSPWLSIRDMNQGTYLSSTKEEITALGVKESNIKLVPEGTVVFSFKLSIGKTGITQRAMYTNEAIAALPIKDKKLLCKDYLVHALSKIDIAKTTDRAVMGATLNKKKLAKLQIPLPPLAEQKRIAAILDKADALRQKRKQAIELTETFLRSVFLEMFYGNRTEYESWPEVLVDKLAVNKKGSMRTGPFGSALKHSEFVDAGIAVLGIDNAVQNKFAWSERRFISEEKYQGLKRYRVFPDDVIITIMGTTGRSAVVPNDIPTAISTKHLATITLNRELIAPEFFAYSIHSHPEILRQISDANRGAIMDGLNLTIIRNLSLRLPPLPKQKLFVRILKTARSLAARMRGAEQDEGLALFESLAQDMFTPDPKQRNLELHSTEESHALQL